MKVIYKYPISVDRDQPVTLPIGAKILCIKEQHSQLFMWALIDQEEDTRENVTILMYGTGYDVREPSQEYIDTVYTSGGDYVWHFFKKLA